jgi:hypothetical protein
MHRLSLEKSTELEIVITSKGVCLTDWRATGGKLLTVKPMCVLSIRSHIEALAI